MNKCTLPVNIPVISTYPEPLHLLSIISNNKNYIEWFYANFIQLFIEKEYDFTVLIRFYDDYLIENYIHYCPFVSYQKINLDLVTTWESNIIELLIDCIDKNYYIKVLLDSFYISRHTYFFQNIHRRHSALIYGYNKENKTFAVADFFDKRYQFIEVSFEEISNGITKSYNPIEVIELYKHRKNVEYKFDISKMVSLLEDYLLSKRTSDFLFFTPKQLPKTPGLNVPKQRDGFTFGLSVIEELILKTKLMVESKELIYFDIRSIQTLLEHKRCMLQRLEFLHEIGNIEINQKHISKVTELQKLVEKIRNIGLKYNFTHTKDNLISIINLSTELLEKEKLFLEDFLEYLSVIAKCN